MKNKILTAFLSLFVFEGLKSQGTVQIGISKVKDIYESKVYKDLHLNNWRLLLNDKKIEAVGIVFFNDSTNQSVVLNFKKELKVDVLPPKNSDLRKQKQIFNRKVKSTVLKTKPSSSTSSGSQD